MNLQFLILTLTLVGTSFCAVLFEDATIYSKPALTDNKTLLNKTDSSQAIASDVSSTAAPKTTSSTTVAPKTTSTTIAATTSTTVAPTTTSTTVAPTTTSTTVAPTTTSAPNVTTQAPNNTTTTVAPPPAPKAGQWVVKEKNVTCIVANMLINLNISYPGKNKTEFVVLTIDGNGKSLANGSCGNNSQTLEITLDDKNSVLFTFNANATSNQFAISSIKVTVNVSALPNGNGNVSNLVYTEDKPLFSTPLAMSYKCNKWQTVNLTNAETNLTATFKVSDTQIQAFRTDAEVKFGDAQDCEPMDTPDMVPIAVGVSLGVMILVVLVAYLIGRRRINPSGYVSM